MFASCRCDGGCWLQTKLYKDVYTAIMSCHVQWNLFPSKYIHCSRLILQSSPHIDRLPHFNSVLNNIMQLMNLPWVGAKYQHSLCIHQCVMIKMFACFFPGGGELFNLRHRGMIRISPKQDPTCDCNLWSCFGTLVVLCPLLQIF